MADKPKQWSQEYASIFQDSSVVAAYRYRPPYPPETFSFLLSLIPATASQRIILDAGCGTGFITRPLAASVDHIDAIDISPAMIATGQTLPNGDRPNITWRAAPIETAPLHNAYSLIVAAASLHWMEWEQTLPRFARHLVAGGVLAIVEERAQANPWDVHLGPILYRYSMNTDFSPYDMTTIVSELEHRHLFQLRGSYETPPMRFQQSIDAWLEAFHARNGFSRDRMDTHAAEACDAALRAAVLPYCPDGIVEQHIAARILWGAPLIPK
jgi:SAM-dependent methyltransferase